MPGSRRFGCFRVPPVDGKIGISTSNHKPVDGVGGNESTDFTSEFLERCHGLCSNSGSCLRTLPDAVFLYTELLDFQIKRRPWNSKLGSCTIWPGNFPLVDQHARKPYVKAAVHHPYASHFASKATSDRITVLGDVLPPCRVPLRDPPCAWKPAVVGTTSVEAVDLASTVLALRGIGDNQRLL
jgi:hypothetical protein